MILSPKKQEIIHRDVAFIIGTMNCDFEIGKLS